MARTVDTKSRGLLVLLVVLLTLVVGSGSFFRRMAEI